MGPFALADTAGNFWAENKYLLALAVSLLALVVSIITARQNVNTIRETAEKSTSHAEGMARTATYQRIHELLVEPSAASGRRRLFQAAQKGKFLARERRAGMRSITPWPYMTPSRVMYIEDKWTRRWS